MWVSSSAVSRSSFSRSTKGQNWDLLGSALSTRTSKSSQFLHCTGLPGVLGTTLTALDMSTPPLWVSCLSLRVSATVSRESHVAQSLFAVIVAFKWKTDIIAVLSQHTAVHNVLWGWSASTGIEKWQMLSTNNELKQFPLERNLSKVPLSLKSQWGSHVASEAAHKPLPEKTYSISSYGIIIFNCFCYTDFFRKENDWLLLIEHFLLGTSAWKRIKFMASSVHSSSVPYGIFTS